MAIQVYIANTTQLIREGMKTLLNNQPGIDVCGATDCYGTFSSEVVNLQPDVLLVDYTSNAFKLSKIATVKAQLPNTKLLGITATNIKYIISQALDAGVTSHILNECDEQEIIDAVTETAKGEKFFCGKIVDVVFNGEIAKSKKISGNLCDPVKISERELEIVKLIAEGFTNKEIAEQLFLSTHTITTHRKNIMNKLGVKNTAGIVMYAIKSNIASPDSFDFLA